MSTLSDVSQFSSPEIPEQPISIRELVDPAKLRPRKGKKRTTSKKLNPADQGGEGSASDTLSKCNSDQENVSRVYPSGIVVNPTTTVPGDLICRKSPASSPQQYLSEDVMWVGRVTKTNSRSIYLEDVPERPMQPPHRITWKDAEVLRVQKCILDAALNQDSPELNQDSSELNQDSSELDRDSSELNQDSSELNQDGSELNQDSSGLDRDTPTAHGEQSIRGQSEEIRGQKGENIYKEASKVSLDAPLSSLAGVNGEISGSGTERTPADSRDREQTPTRTPADSRDREQTPATPYTQTDKPLQPPTPKPTNPYNRQQSFSRDRGKRIRLTEVLCTLVYKGHAGSLTLGSSGCSLYISPLDDGCNGVSVALDRTDIDSIYEGFIHKVDSLLGTDLGYISQENPEECTLTEAQSVVLVEPEPGKNEDDWEQGEQWGQGKKGDSAGESPRHYDINLVNGRGYLYERWWEWRNGKRRHLKKYVKALGEMTLAEKRSFLENL